jgi:hypothetical protein
MSNISSFVLEAVAGALALGVACTIAISREEEQENKKAKLIGSPIFQKDLGDVDFLPGEKAGEQTSNR